MIPPLHPIADAIRQHHRFLVTTHVNPDGDAIGSMLAMAWVLRALDKEVALFNESGLPRRFDWITGGEAIANTLPPSKPEIIIVLDCGDIRRPGEVIQPWLATLPIINLDHHLGNPHFGTYNWVDQRMAATGEMVGMLARVFGIPLAGPLGEALYLALTADTGDFCYDNTRPQTLEMAAEILRQGLQPGPFYERKHATGTLRQLQMRGEVLQKAQLFAGGRICLFQFTQELFARTGTGPEDTEGLVNEGLSIRGVDVAVSLREERDRIKFSLRSKGETNVQRVAVRFGGGGHRNAAGGAIPTTSLDDAIVTIIAAITEELEGACSATAS